MPVVSILFAISAASSPVPDSIADLDRRDELCGGRGLVRSVGRARRETRLGGYKAVDCCGLCAFLEARWHWKALSINGYEGGSWQKTVT